MWIKLAIAGAIFASLMGAFGSFIYAQREIGAATVRAELAEQQREAAALDAQRALEAEAHAKKLLGAAQKRAKVAEAQANSDALARWIDSDARAKEDIEYALWRESRVPAYAAGRLRDATLLAAHESRGGVLPSGTGVSPGQGVSPAPGAVDESWAGRIRAFLGRANPADLGSGGAVAK